MENVPPKSPVLIHTAVIRPCPTCRSADVLARQPSADSPCFVECKGCGARGQGVRDNGRGAQWTLDEAVYEWNRGNVAPAPVPAQVQSGCLGCNKEAVEDYLRRHGEDPGRFIEVPRPTHDWKDIACCTKCGRAWLALPGRTEPGVKTYYDGPLRSLSIGIGVVEIIPHESKGEKYEVVVQLNKDFHVRALRFEAMNGRATMIVAKNSEAAWTLKHEAEQSGVGQEGTR
jgi:hypothetical protein